MTIHFVKYQGTGNDFVMIDNRANKFPKNDTKLIAFLCDRRFGIGADGLILLENDSLTDFKMVYYNADGRESSMCGNGGRCIVAFAHDLGVINSETRFMAVDGEHYAQIADSKVALQMIDVDRVNWTDDFAFVQTGSPHHVVLVNELEQFPVKAEGARIRYSELYGAAGCNINFVEALPEGGFALRTYERGVEDETLSCGTGATAVALALHAKGLLQQNEVKLKVQGGELQLRFQPDGTGGYRQVFLVGPAKRVFQGTIEVEAYD